MDAFKFALRVSTIIAAVATGEMAAFSQATAPIDEAVPIPERNVSLSAKQLPRKATLESICRQAGASLVWDYVGLTGTGLKPDELVTVEVADETFAQVITEVLNPDQYRDVIYEIHGNKVHLTSLAAKTARDKEHRPEWAAPMRGLHTYTDPDGEVIRAYLSGEEVTDEVMARLATLPRLRELEMNDADRLTAKGIAALANLPSLEVLELHSTPRLGDAALDAIRGHASLRALEISRCDTTDAGVLRLVDLPQLRKLTLQEEPRLTDAAIASIAQLHSLRELNLIGHVNHEGLGRMHFSADALGQLSSLQQLEILTTPGSDFPLSILPHPRLRVLGLSGPNVGDRIAARALQCPNLKSINFDHTAISDDTLKRLPSVTGLQNLSIRSGNVTDEGLRHTVSLDRLRSLSLLNLPVTNRGLSHIAQIKSLRRITLSGKMDAVGLSQLEALPRLRTVWLHGVSDPAGFADLKSLKQVKYLHFELCTITPAQLDALDESLPQTFLILGTGGGTHHSKNKPHPTSF